MIYALADAASDCQGPVVNQGDKAALPYWQEFLQRTLAIGWWIAILAVYVAAYRHQPHVILVALSLLVGAFICTLAHEAGHAAAALACGWRIIVFVVRPLAWQIPNRNLVVLPRDFKKQFRGWVATVPNQFDSREKEQWCTILAAGPAASLALALIAFFGCWLFSEEPDHAGIAFSGVALGLGLQSLKVCVFAILPSAADGVASDGAQWRAARRTDSNYEASKALQWIGTMLHYNVRLRDLPEWLLARVEDIPAPLAEVSRACATLRIGQVLDSSPVDAALARRLIDQFRASNESSEWLTACDTYLTAMWEADLDRARALLAERADLPVTTPVFMAAEAAVAARAGERDVARERVKAMVSARRRESPFRDPTFRDIRSQIEALLA